MDICFWLRRNDATNKQGKASIYCTITVNGLPCVPFSTGCRAIAKNWDVKAKTTKDEFRDVIRQELNEIENKLRQVKLLLEHSSDILTAELIKTTYLSLKAKQVKPVKQVKEIRFFELFRMHLKEKKDLGAKDRTQTNDLVLYNNIYNYTKGIQKTNIRVKSVNLDFIEEFKKHLRIKKISINHINRHISIISKVLDLGVRKRLIESNPIASIKLKYSETFDPLGLDLKGVQALENYKPQSKYEEIVLDNFLFLCGSGIDHCDFLKLKNENLRTKNGKYLLRHERQKTDTYLTDEVFEANPILKPCAVRILEKYGTIEAIPKIKNSQNINRIMKGIGYQLGIRIDLTTKRGRKTFANLSVNHEGHRDEQTAYQLGHTTTKQLKHYRKYNDSILDDLL